MGYKVFDSDGNLKVTTASTGVPAHSPTHEAGGADEIDVTGLAGLLADPQTPLAHTSTHQDGGSDELPAETLPTAETDTSLFLRPDGSGGVEFATPPSGSGEANTASNQGAGGVGPFKQKTGVDLEFRNINAEDAAITVALDAGNDEIDIGLGPHASRHENGGSDEINVAGLSGLLADAQTPTSHAASHQDGGADEINVAGLSGLLADAQTPTSHASTHEDGGADEINVAGLSGLLADAQTPTAHAASHEDGGADELTVQNLGSTGASAGQILEADGAGGLAFVTPSSGMTFGTEYEVDSAEALQSTTSGAPVNAITFTTASVPAGTYRIGWSMEANHSNVQDAIQIEIFENGNSIADYEIEPKDTRNWMAFSGFYHFVATAGTQTFTVDYNQTRGGTASLRKLRLEFWRVA